MRTFLKNIYLDLGKLLKCVLPTCCVIELRGKIILEKLKNAELIKKFC